MTEKGGLSDASTVPSPLGRRRSLNSEEMAVFYKSFLDKNRIRHADYNKWVVLQLGVSQGAAVWVGGCVSSGSCSVLHLVCREQQTSTSNWAFGKLAWKGGWIVFEREPTTKNIFLPHTPPMRLLFPARVLNSDFKLFIMFGCFNPVSISGWGKLKW